MTEDSGAQEGVTKGTGALEDVQYEGLKGYCRWGGFEQ